MSEQTISKSVFNTEAFKRRVLNLSQRSDAPQKLVEIAAKRYPYGEKFSSYYQQDKDAIYLISIIKTEGINFRGLGKRNKRAKDFIKDWVVPFSGDLTDEEMKIIEEYWLGKNA